MLVRRVGFHWHAGQRPNCMMTGSVAPSLTARCPMMAEQDRSRGRKEGEGPSSEGELLWRRSVPDQSLCLNSWSHVSEFRVREMSLSNASEPPGTAGYENGITGQTVYRLCQEGELIDAVRALGTLVHAEFSVSRSLFYTVLKTCRVKKHSALGRRVHALILEAGYESDTFLNNHILRMYASHARLKEAMDVFTMVVQPDAFMWSSIISAHVQHGQVIEAIQLYHDMRSSSVKADGHVFVAALQACARGADLESGQQVHADVLACGVEPHLFVSNCLIDMYAKCGSLEDAQGVFDRLRHKDVVTWNAMIAGYFQHGKNHEALRLYSCMREEGVTPPDSVTFNCALQACGGVGNPALAQGKLLHSQIEEEGLQNELLVGNNLINMYVKCGSLEDARSVFDRRPQKDVVTWTSLIAGYSQHGMGQEALHLYSGMVEEGISAPNSVTFVCLLLACASVGAEAIERGKQIHAQIEKQGLQSDVILCNSLINMYVKCSSLEDAQVVFDGLHQKDVVTWNAMIAGYSQQDMGDEALHLYGAMRDEGILLPNSVTFVCLLQACASLGVIAIEMGKQLHAEIEEQGLQDDVFVANSLINMYMKCGSLQLAQTVFNNLPRKDVVTWTTLVAGYSQQGRGQEALDLYSAIQAEGIEPLNSVAFLCLLKACASVGAMALDIGKQLHAQIVRQGFQGNVSVANSLINMYARCGSLRHAQSIFDQISQKDVVTWTSLIAGYAEEGMAQEALHLYSAMQDEGLVPPDSVTFACLLQACASMGELGLETGKQLHGQIQEQGRQLDIFVANSLIDMYAKCGSLQDAQNVFYGLTQKEVVTWTALISGYSQQGMGEEALRLYTAMQEGGVTTPNSATYVCLLQACASVGFEALEKGKRLHVQIEEQGLQAHVTVGNNLINMYAKCGSLEDARSVFDGLGVKDVVTWNVMIAGYSEQGKATEALELYTAMREEIVTLDVVTFVCLLQACAIVGALHLGRDLHVKIKQLGLENNSSVAISLIDMYAKAGSVDEAQQVFEALPRKHIVAWNALLAGYTRQGDCALVLDLVRRMREHGIHPDGITFLSVLTVCSHAGLVNTGQEYFEAMSRDYSISPSAEHYSCMVDLLGRSGQLDQALALVRAMPVQPQDTLWRTLLSACGKWKSVEVGRHAFEEAVKLNKNDAAAYVLMSNIYASAQMWEQAKEIQARRKEIGSWKQPGQCWWTDMDGLVHSFMVGSQSNSAN